jgi:hypothetical protein
MTPEFIKELMGYIITQGISFAYDPNTHEGNIKIGEYEILPPIVLSGPWPEMKLKE